MHSITAHPFVCILDIYRQTMNYTIELIKTFAIALILTVIVEEILALIMGFRAKLELVIILLVNTLTNPLMMLYYTFIRSKCPDLNGVLLQLPGELLVVIIEAYVFKKMGKTKDYCFDHPILLSIALNVTSWMIGILLETGGII